MDRKRFTIEVPWPNFGKVRLAHLLPTPGNMIFTFAMIALLVAAQTVGALPPGRPLAAPNAASTGTIAYQGRLADSAGAPLTGTYNMIFRLYDMGAGGAPLWEEQWTGSNGVKVSDGLFNIMLGSLVPLQQSIIVGHDQLYLGITVGTDDEMAPRVQLGSVPFAVQALTVPDGSVTTAKLANEAATRVISVRGTTFITNTGGWADMPDMSITLTTGENPVEIYFDCGFSLDPHDTTYGEFALFIDGLEKLRKNKGVDYAAVGPDRPGLSMSLYWLEALGAGSHTIKVKWLAWPLTSTISNNPASVFGQRLLVVKELRR